MATQNKEIGRTYTLIANSSQNFFVTLPWTTNAKIEVATSDTEVAPTVNGHELSGRETESINRAIIGPGFVYARCKSGNNRSIILNVWDI